MPTISRQETETLINNRSDLTIVEVLSESTYRKYHLPGARNVPLDENFAENIQQVAPDKNAPVLVYCMDMECEASSKAAKKLDEMGYKEIFDYEAGKVDWKEAGLPIEEMSGSSV